MKSPELSARVISLTALLFFSGKRNGASIGEASDKPSFNMTALGRRHEPVLDSAKAQAIERGGGSVDQTSELPAIIRGGSREPLDEPS
jgi:hypothetical protein